MRGIAHETNDETLTQDQSFSSSVELDYVATVKGSGEGSFLRGVTLKVNKLKKTISNLSHKTDGSTILDKDLSDLNLGNADECEDEFSIIPAEHEPVRRSCSIKPSWKSGRKCFEGVRFSDHVESAPVYTYDRVNPDMKKVFIMQLYYPREIREIHIELNEFKKGMEIHPESAALTQDRKSVV